MKSGKFDTFTALQKDFSLYVNRASAGVDGVHFADAEDVPVAWGPKTYSVEDGGTVWIDDTPAFRRIHVDAEGKVIEVDEYPQVEAPKDTFGSEQDLSPDQLKRKSELEKDTFYNGFTASEIHYWGTSPEGYEYWQINETRQDVAARLRVHTFIEVFDASGVRVAVGESPAGFQYTGVYNTGVFVDAENNAAYYMSTGRRGVSIQSFDWIKTF